MELLLRYQQTLLLFSTMLYTGIASPALELPEVR